MRKFLRLVLSVFVFAWGGVLLNSTAGAAMVMAQATPDVVGGNTGVLFNSPTPAPGQITNAMQFNGIDSASGSYVSVPSTPGLQGFSAMTICAWVNLTAYDAVDNSQIVAKSVVNVGAYPADPYLLYGLAVTSSGKVYYAISTGAPGSRMMLVSSGSVPLNTWTFVCATYDGTTMRIYINGTADANTTAASLVIGSNSQHVLIGGLMWQGYWDVLQGSLDDVRIYNVALSPGQITDQFQWPAGNGSTNNSAGLAGWWTFDNEVAMQPTTYYIDYSSGSDANNGTSTATPWQHHPYMAGFTGSYNHQVGDNFVFRGGSVWPSSCFPLAPQMGGAGGAFDYYGTNGSWGGGMAVFDGGHASTSAGIVVINGASHINMTGFEIRAMCSAVSDGPGLITTIKTDDINIANCWLHDWTLTNSIPEPGGDGQHGGLINQLSSGWGVTNMVIANSRISNVENVNARQGCCIALWGVITNCLLDDNSSCVLMAQDMNFCVVSNIDNPVGADLDTSYHKNGFYMDDPNGYAAPPPGMNLYCRNSTFVNVCSTPIYPNVDTTDCYVYNCLSYGVQGADQAILLDSWSSGTKLVQHSCYIYNNTVVIGGVGSTGIYTLPRLTLNGSTYSGQIVSNLWITNNLFIGTAAAAPLSYPNGYTNVASASQAVGVYDQYCGNNLALTPSAAASYGYTLANLYSPTSATCPTVGQGTNVCMALFDNDILNHPRPITSWDIGAYQYGTAPVGPTAWNAGLHVINGQ